MSIAKLNWRTHSGVSICLKLFPVFHATRVRLPMEAFRTFFLFFLFEVNNFSSVFSGFFQNRMK